MLTAVAAGSVFSSPSCAPIEAAIMAAAATASGNKTAKNLNADSFQVETVNNAAEIWGGIGRNIPIIISVERKLQR